jgi:hypothetical protein
VGILKQAGLVWIRFDLFKLFPPAFLFPLLQSSLNFDFIAPNLVRVHCALTVWVRLTKSFFISFSGWPFVAARTAATIGAQSSLQVMVVRFKVQ